MIQRRGIFKYLIVLSLLVFIILYFKSRRKAQTQSGFYPPAFENLEPPPQSTKDSKGLGEDGVPVIINYANLTSHEKLEYDAGRKLVYLNTFASDRISVRRYLSDKRAPECRAPKTYSNLPKTSVIIIFHNEVYSMLLRTLHSVLDRSDPDLLEEIILVDDASDIDYINGRLQDYLSYLPKVRLIRLTERAGIAKARMAGIHAANVETLTFLDSHVEVLPGWLEPLLEQLQMDPKLIAVPIYLQISPENLSPDYRESFKRLVGGFRWNLEFFWQFNSPNYDNRPGSPYSPVINPALVGGMFMIGKQFFNSLGNYDNTLGCDRFIHLELTLKAWLCHGSIFKVPCSSVGSVSNNLYQLRSDQATKEIKLALDRIVYVWFDEYKIFYEDYAGQLFKDLGNLSGLIDFRVKNKCHNFKWFLENVYIDKFDPMTAVFRGQIRNPKSNMCLDSATEIYPCVTPSMKLQKNITQSISTIWYLSLGNYMQTEYGCITTNQINNQTKIQKADCKRCFGLAKSFYNKKNRQIRIADKCLEMKMKPADILLNPCKKGNEYQVWNWMVLK